MPAVPSFSPFAARGRRTIVAILGTFAFFSTLNVALSIRATARSQHRAAVLQVAARQRMLAERYVNQILLVRQGKQADPRTTGVLLTQSAAALLNGGAAAAADGDDDETRLTPTKGKAVRAQLEQEAKLVRDLTGTGDAILAGRPVTSVRQTAHERIEVTDPIERLRVLSALTANVSLDAARSIGASNDRNISDLIRLQVILGLLGLLTSLLLGWALIAATRRQTAHFRSLVTSSTDLVLVFGAGGCWYVSDSVVRMLGCDRSELLGAGVTGFVHLADRAALEAACDGGEGTIVLRIQNRLGEWRHLEAHVTDLRSDRRIRGVVLNARDVTERVRLEEQLTRQAFHDALTDLPNRALFRDRLSHVLAKSERTNEPLAVLLLDLDGFKQVNDSLGHDAGDQLLQHVARRFGHVIRPTDTLARLGGDEFAVVLEGAQLDTAVAVVERLFDRLAEKIDIGDHALVLGASVGIALHAGGRADAQELVRQADLAMYAAKEGGRGRYEVFHDEMARELGELVGLEQELRAGLERGEFSLHYQPEIALASGEIVGVEALLRWHSPSRGLVPPMRFIPVAETTGLILALGEFVLREACRQTAEWRRDGLVSESFVTWVNLSGRQLTTGGIGALVEQVLAEFGLPASVLGLEVTETAVIEEGFVGEHARRELESLRGHGVRIAIDDFGTGFSSLGQLRRFPVDVIKVDRSFVQGVEDDPKDAAIAANLVGLAHALGLLAIAEGIESDGQRTSFKDLGCDLAQGYLFARPVPADEVAALLAAGGSYPAEHPGTAAA